MSETAKRLHEAGDAHAVAGRLEAALAAYGEAEALDPASPFLPYNAGNVLRRLKRYADALAAYDRAIALRPHFPEARHNRAIALLHLGDFAQGFPAYEWRKTCPGYDDPRYALPNQWTGGDLRGRSLFIYPELYQGDLIQFVRYARLAEMAGARVSLAAPASMHRLLRTLSPTIELLPEDARPQGHDDVSALMSLPAMFGTTLASIPAAPRYLLAEAERVARWRAQIGDHGLKVGVAWSGSARSVDRSFPLAALKPLADIPGVRLISLQKHAGLEQLDSLPADMSVETLGEDFDPGPDAFLDTAAAMAAVDLIITPDTSVAHLAGALGAPVWIGLPWLADWRWLEDRSDTPWYPSARLFRQKAPGAWGEVIAEMTQVLRQMASLRDARRL